ncbi:uncharacterized protein LOC126742608 [Anthonomus grandis grandis]|uniref:uncharacterized protein LOC126742608 n=1 Tax=Anthonomus grandis grandis TaxID=2921223 RepID=UPI002165F209|nr:uncharacterized protein LOC126742608 [Anthonomus grandis grandis]
MRTAYRLYVLGELRAGETGHAKIWSRAIEECPLLLMGSDCMAPMIMDCEGFVTHIAGREEWQHSNRPALLNRGTIWYTDGFRMNNRVGSGLCGGIPHTSRAYSLGEHATVFQAEVFAVLKCGQKILSCGHRNTVVSICSDSRAAIKAITTAKVGRRVQLVWIPVHAGHAGNKEADSLARLGSANVPIGPEPIVGIAKCVAVASMKGLMDKLTHRRWTESPGMRQAKAHIGGPSACLTKNLLRLKRREIRLVTGLLIGHWHLRNHRYCGQLGMLMVL